MAMAEAPTSTALKTVSNGALQQTSTPQPIATHAPGLQAPDATLTLNLVNSWTVPLSITGHNAQPGPTPTIEPYGVWNPDQTTSYQFPTGWAGMIAIRKTFDADNSKVEISFVNPTIDFDVSYVDGYSLPVTCGCEGDLMVSGCNKPLFSISGDCPADLLRSAGRVCLNNAGDFGPALPFFAPCEQEAYTYPKDDLANYNGGRSNNIVHCCIGTSYAANTRTRSEELNSLVK